MANTSNDAVVIVGSLNDQELQNAVNNLVKHVEQGTQKMVGDFDRAIQQMKTSLQSLGNVNINMGGNDGGIARRTRRNIEETAAVKETTVAYDQLAVSMQRAMQPKSAEQSYIAFIQNYREQAARLANELKTMPAQSLDKQFAEYQRFETQINHTRQVIQELRDQLNQVGSKPNASRFEIKAITDEIGILEQRVKQLTTEQLASTKRIADQDRAVIAQKQADYNRTVQLVRELTSEGQRSTQATTQQAAAQAQVTQEQQSSLRYTREQIDAYRQIRDNIRDSARELKNAFALSPHIQQQFYRTISNVTGNETVGVIYRENDARAQGMSIEQQILEVKKQQQLEERAYLAAKAASATQSQQQLGIEQAITRENEKRRTYKQPNIGADYQKMLANVLGLDKAALKYGEDLRSMTTYVNQLKNAYDRLNASERQSPFGKNVIADIQVMERTIQRLRNEMSRPINLNQALGLPARTLDDISYKMQMLSKYRSGLDLNTQTKEIKDVNKAIDELKKKQSEAMAQNKTWLESNNALARSFNYMKNRLAFYFTVGASTQFLKNLIEVRSQYEMNERALGILIDSAERGSQIFQELSNMALVSPYTLIELSAAAKQLTAYDVAAKDVVDTTRRLADMASAVGVPLERLTYALGQIKAYGYLNARDNRMFANAGIPLVKQLADYYTELEGKLVTSADVYDRIKKKAIDYNTVMQVVYKMTDEGGKFFNFQAKMADTLKVRLANLTLAWNNMLNDIGKESQGAITTVIGMLRKALLHWRELNRAIENVAWAATLIIAVRALNVLLVKSGLQWRILRREMTATSIAGAGVATRMKAVAASLKGIMTSPLVWWSLLAFAIVDVVRALGSLHEAQEKLNTSIRDGAKDNYENITKFLEQYKDIRNELTAASQSNGKTQTSSKVDAPVISQEEAKKAWEAIQEQIQLTTKNADQYISRLISINDLSERVKQGFAALEEIQVVNAALKELGEDTIKVDGDFTVLFMNIRDGLITNLKDVKKSGAVIEKMYGSIAEGLEKFKDKSISETPSFILNYQKDLEKFQAQLSETTNSVLAFIHNKGWDAEVTKIDETFSQVFNKIAQNANLDPQTAFAMQLEAEEARTKAVKQGYEIRINDEKRALAVARDENNKEAIKATIERLEEERNFINNSTNTGRVYWRDFTKWMTEQHKSEVQQMFNYMDSEQIKSLDFSKDEYFKWVNEMVTKYANEHKLSQDEVFGHLRSWIRNANQWSITIPLIISSNDQKSIYDTLKEADSAIDAAYETIKRLDKRKKELEKKGGAMSNDTKVVDEYKKVTNEIAAAEKDRKKAEAAGGHSKKEEADAKKASAAAKKAQAQAESELQKALKEEFTLLDKVRSVYKQLTKEGVDSRTAIEDATSGYEESVRAINETLSKYGITPLDLSKYAGVSNPREILSMLQSQLDTLMKSGKAKPSEIKDLQVKLKDIKVEATTFDYQKITEGLNNELSKVKEEYELGIELDANPEMGEVFADMMGLTKEQLADMPRDFQGVLRKMQTMIDTQLGSGKFNLEENLNKAVFERWVNEQGKSMDSEQIKSLKNYIEYANKVRRDETKTQIQEWDKLLEKYAEYEYKINKITEEAAREREIAYKKGASQDIIDAINRREREQKAQVSFEEYQKSPQWMQATGDLAMLSRQAIGMLIQQLENYKKHAKDLNPKQIKQLNNALNKLYKEQRKNNPFHAISDMIHEAKQHAAEYDEAINDVASQIGALSWKEATGEITGKQEEKLKSLREKWKELKDAQNAAGHIDATQWVSAINTTISAVKQGVDVFHDLAKAISGVNTDDVDRVFSVIEKGGEGAAMGAQIGQGYGAIIGAAAGVATGIIQQFSDQWSGNRSITKKIEESERAVKRLELTYIDLEHAMDKAYGTGVVGANRQIAATKELELAEKERQLALEESRKSKNRDDDKIVELRKEIKQLKYEISDIADEIADALLGTDAGSFAEDLVKSMIEAFRKGEDYMQVFEEKFDTMVDNMIMKAIVSRVVASYMDRLWASMDERISAKTSKAEEDYKRAAEERERIESMSVEDYFKQKGENGHVTHERAEELSKMYLAELEVAKNAEKAAREAITAASEIDKTDISALMEELAEIKPELGQRLKEIFGEYYKFGDAMDKDLSALQQGIQGITEDTAGAIEAYMNGMSQQVYLQSTLLTQIRDAVVQFDIDVQVATMSQILLQLQASYQAQMVIQSTLTGWSTPSGMAVRVELTN